MKSKPKIITRTLAILATGALTMGAVLTSGVSQALADPVAGLSQAVVSPVVKNEVTVQDGKDVIVVLYHWNWKSIAKECTNVLGPKGYGYVQTSPPQESIKGTQWWTVYQPVSYNLNSKFGTEAEFKSMVETCKTAGVGVIADAVVNHMTGSNGGTGTGGTTFSKLNYPGLYSSSDFHSECEVNDYKKRANVQNCWLVNLQDLKTESDYVRGKIAGYFDKLANYGVAGFRVDAVKHIPAADMEAIRNKTTSAKNLIWFYEVIGASGEDVEASEYLDSGDVQEFNYAWWLKGSFDGDIRSLQNMGQGLIASNEANVFVDNHDTERPNYAKGETDTTMNYKWGAKYKLGNIFMLAYPYGSPTVHSGYEFTNREYGPSGSTDTTVPDASCGSGSQWTCVHTWNEVGNMVGFHNAVRGSAVTNWQSPVANVISFGRGDKGQIVLNNTASSINLQFTTSVPDGTYCDIVSGTYEGGVCGGTTVTVSGGKFQKTIPAYGALAFYVGGSTPTQCEGDTKAPTVPGNVKATAEGTTVNVTWGASTDDCAAAINYEVTLTSGGKNTVQSTTGTSLSVAGLTANTTYLVSVKAIDGSKNKNTSAASTATSVKTGSGPVDKSVNVYYSTSKGWAKYYIHYRVDAGNWTTVPGEQMSPACTGWVSKEINIGQGTTLEAVFNNGDGIWDNNGGINQNYKFTNSIVAVNNGTVTTTNPCPSGDTQAPTTPTSVTAKANGTSGAVLSWKASSDNVGVAAYVVTRTGDGKTVNTVVNGSKTALSVAGLKSGVKYRFIVRARDAAGNVSVAASVYHTPVVDKTAPSKPTSLNATQLSTTSVKLAWKAATDNVGVVAYDVVQVSQDGVVVAKRIDGSSLSHTFTGLTKGKSYKLQVRARDAAGNVSAYAVIPVTVS